jgi:uncharacterized protein
MPEIDRREDGVYLRVRVQPRASRNQALPGPDGTLRVALMAPPVEGAANQALEAYLAKALGVAKSSVAVVSGLKSRDKTVRFRHADPGKVEGWLQTVFKG